MSKALELLANIDKKYNSRISRNNFERYRANVTDYQRQLEHKSQYHSDRYPTVGRKISAEHTGQLTASREAAEQYQALLQSKLSRLKQMNEQIQTEEQQVQNKSLLKQLTTLNMALILGVAILIMLIIALGFMGKSKYSEIRTLNMAIDEKQMRVDHLNRSGGSLTFSTCKQPNSKAQRLCIQINKDAGEWQNNFMVQWGIKR
jgi:hypothetical protein